MTPQPVAVFDLDCTILDTDCEKLWTDFMFAHKLVDNIFVKRIAEFFQDYDQGKLDGVAYEEFFLSPLTKNPPEKLQLLRETYLDIIKGHFRPQMLTRIKQHRDNQFILLLITFSNSFLAGPIADLLGFENVLCSRVEIKNGLYTGKLENIPAQKEIKAQRLKDWLKMKGLFLEGSWGYGDSQNDLPLLTMVEYPVAVAPDPVLRQHALQNNWEILDFQDSL